MRDKEDGWTSNPNYKVGYKNPPKHSRFKKGESGNKKGRPSKVKGRREFLEAALNEAATITENGKVKAMPKQQIIYKVLVANAMKGNGRAMSTLFKQMDDLGLANEPAVKGLIVKFVRPEDPK